MSVVEIDLTRYTRAQLRKLSRELGLGLSVEELEKVRAYFASKKRNPTDVELQCIAQAWSEHCCYKSSLTVLRKFFFSLVNADVLAREDAGVVAFSETHAYALRIESHNHPSAIEPYGGAATGIGGIVRDILCMGAQPVALVDVLFFGKLDAKVQRKAAHQPRYLLEGVVKGISDYGNRIGIPTVAGGVYFDNGYLYNCVVNVGCVGVLERDKLVHSRVGGAGDVLVLAGGLTGRDGVHGVTFASRSLTEESEKDKPAVQLGDPITKEPLIHCCLEASEQGLLEGMKDLGGGGLSCAVTEMVYGAACGAEVVLEKVPVKTARLLPWEIWVSESQERMLLAVREENVARVKKIFGAWDIPAVAIGKVLPEKTLRVCYEGAVVLELDLDFLLGNTPIYRRKRRRRSQQRPEKHPPAPRNYEKILFGLLAAPNITSKAWVVRQYDYDVRAQTVIKPLQATAQGFGHNDAVVLKPVRNSARGLAVAVGTAVNYSQINPFRGGKCAVDEVCRNLAAVGAQPHSLTNCLNFGSPEKGAVFNDFYETVRGMAEVARVMALPIPAGNVSFYNEHLGRAIPPTPVVLGVGVVDDIRRCVTQEFKGGGVVYLLGATKNELGGSAYYKLRRGFSSNVPNVRPQMLKTYCEKLHACTDEGLLLACHDLAEGGLLVALAEMCIPRKVGVCTDISTVAPRLRSDIKLFSESATRWLVEVARDATHEFENVMCGCDCQKLGETRKREQTFLVVDGARELLQIPISELREAWSGECV